MRFDITTGVAPRHLSCTEVGWSWLGASKYRLIQSSKGVTSKGGPLFHHPYDGEGNKASQLTAIGCIEVGKLGTERVSETLIIVSIRRVAYGIPLYVNATYNSCACSD
jgi:hypothetical protein